MSSALGIQYLHLFAIPDLDTGSEVASPDSRRLYLLIRLAPHGELTIYGSPSPGQARSQDGAKGGWVERQECQQCQEDPNQSETRIAETLNPAPLSFWTSSSSSALSLLRLSPHRVHSLQELSRYICARAMIPHISSR